MRYLNIANSCLGCGKASIGGHTIVPCVTPSVHCLLALRDRWLRVDAVAGGANCPGGGGQQFLPFRGMDWKGLCGVGFAVTWLKGRLLAGSMRSGGVAPSLRDQDRLRVLEHS